MFRGQRIGARRLLGVVAALALGFGSVVAVAPAARAAGAQPPWQLPFQNGQKWAANGPHHDLGAGGSKSTWGSIDFGPQTTGTSKKVVSVAPGTVFKISCKNGWYLGIDHGNGWKSTYYHLVNQQGSLVGKWVDAGRYLGDVGNATPCGGYSSAPHVHLTILKDNKYTSVDGFRFGNYRVSSGKSGYLGEWKDLKGNSVITSNGYMTGSLTSTTARKLSAQPTPTVSGSAKVGVKLAAKAGAWQPAPVTLKYQWFRNGSRISGATKSTYTLAAADRGAKISVKVTASKTRYATATKASAQTAVVKAGTLTAPAPRLSGEPRVGEQLTLAAGAWGPNPVTLKYQWLRDGAAITGATKTSYTLTPQDLGKRITAKVSGAKEGYSSAAQSSAPIGPVIGLRMAAGQPEVSGQAELGSVLTAAPGVWDPAEAKLSYRWLRDGKPIKGATAPRYKLTTADAGTKVSVAVTGELAGYETTTVMSAAKKLRLLSVENAPKPKIAGKTKVGAKLTAKVGKWQPGGMAKSYQWLRNGKPIKGATKKSYKLVSADKGKRISVKVTGAKTGYKSKSVKSAPTKKVAPKK